MDPFSQMKAKSMIGRVTFQRVKALFLFSVWLIGSVKAQELTLLKTPPATIATMNEQQLNAFGFKAAEEVYSILAKHGTPTDHVGFSDEKLKQKAVRNSRNLLDEHALIQRSTLNYGVKRSAYIPTDIDNFRVSDVKMTRVSHDVLVATYYVSLPNRVDQESGVLFSGALMPRITVLRWNKNRKQWLIFSHADFDTPQATLCGFKMASHPNKSKFKADDVKLGSKLIYDLVYSKLQGEIPSVYAEGYQIILASGERNTPSKPIASLSKPVEPTHLQAVKSGDLIAIRYDMPNALHLKGETLAQKFSPRLLTYQRNPEGQWQLIASAVFGVTASVAQGIECKKPTAQ